MKERKRVGGASANRLMIPIIATLTILHIMIIADIRMINVSSASLSTIMQNSGVYTQEATSVLAGSSLLSETASNYVLMPTTETGEVNVFPLMSYAAELAAEDHRGDRVLAKFQDYDVSGEALSLLSAAADSAGSMLEAEKSGYSMAVLLFDVNFLKRTNDTLGHLAGDKLIRTAAECISSCFGENCFRYGGDEFAAVIRDCTPEGVRQMVSRFEEAEKQKNVSISWGCAYAPEIGSTSFRQLLDEADQHMYVHKQAVHSREGHGSGSSIKGDSV